MVNRYPILSAAYTGFAINLNYLQSLNLLQIATLLASKLAGRINPSAQKNAKKYTAKLNL